MASCRFQLFGIAIALIALLGLPCTATPAQHVRKLRRTVNVQEVEADLQASLAAVLGGTSSETTRRLAHIEAATWQTFQSLPKNSAGRLSPPAVRYLVHGYFAKEHGWLIKGLEPHGMQASGATQVHDVNILQDKVPLLVEKLLEVRQADRGLALSDVVAMVAVLEQLMFEESNALLEAAYVLNDLSVDNEIDEATLHKVLQSYLILFGQGSKADLSNATKLQTILGSVQRTRPEIVEFETDTVQNFEFRRRHDMNHFKADHYSYSTVNEIMRDMAEQYGKWQNVECRDMKAHLKELDQEGLGRVPLGLFYAQPKGSAYHFSESSDYLRQIGALDEVSSPGSPQVVIANYVTGPSNCIASSAYYSVCCLSECDSILAEIEHKILAPKASPERILGLVRNMSDAKLTQSLSEKLHTIARQHDGEVPLHGRLFAQWLHFAFPHECPYPSVVESATALTASQWLEGQSVASTEEKSRHLEAPLPKVESSLNIDDLWTDHEVLPVYEEPSSPLLQKLMRYTVQFAVIIFGLRSAHAAWSSASLSISGANSKKNDDLVLPFRV